MTADSSCSLILPWPTTTRTSGPSIFWMPGGGARRCSPPGCGGSRPGRPGPAPGAWRPPARPSRAPAHRSAPAGGPAGGSSRVDMSRRPERAMFSVRGMGVAERVSTSTWRLISFSRSLWVTPKRCSSSITSRPRSLNSTSLLQQLVGADEQVHAAVFGGLAGSASAPWAGVKRESTSIFTGKSRNRLHGGGVVLLGQDGGGHQDGGLLAVQDALHHGPEGHLRLAVAHVAAQQPVHGPGLLHVRLDLRDAPQLVVGLGVVKGLLKLPLPGGVRGEGEARPLLPLGVQLR